MTEFKIIYSKAAITELRNIYQYIALNLSEPEIAKGQVDRIRKAVYSLDYMPERYVRVYPELLNKNIRKFTVDNYVIYYEVDNNNKKVMILHILNGRQNADKIIK